MYIIACIKNRVIYSKEDYITPSLILARIRLGKLRGNGDKHSKIYEIMELKEVE